MWPHRDHGTPPMWMCELLRVAVALYTMCYKKELLCFRLGDVLTQHNNARVAGLVLRVEMGQINIIFNLPHPSILLHFHDKTTHNTILLLIQQIKRDIIYRRKNLPPLCGTSKSHPTTCRTPRFYHMKAMLISTILWSCQILQGCWDSVASTRNQSHLTLSWAEITMLLTSFHVMMKTILSPAKTKLPMHTCALSIHIGLAGQKIVKAFKR
jgi:hypothetical protein